MRLLGKHYSPAGRVSTKYALSPLYYLTESIGIKIFYGYPIFAGWKDFDKTIPRG
jgi:hypothetical protein